MDISTINSDLIRGNVTTIILKALDDGTSYGYDILKLIEEKTNGKYIIKQPTLYSCLKRLEKQGLISSYMGTDDDTSGARRRYYSLTQLGADYLHQQQSEYEFSRTILDRLLSDQVYDLASEDVPFDINDLRPYTKVSLENGEDAAQGVKVVEKVVEKPIYVEKPVEKVVYVDRPVEKVVYVEKPVEKLVYVDRPSEDRQVQQDNSVNAPSGIIINNQNRDRVAQQYVPQPAQYQQYVPQQEQPQQQYVAPQPEPAPQPAYTAPAAPAYTEQPTNEYQNTHSGIIINQNNRPQRQAEYQQSINNNAAAYQQRQTGAIPQAPLINRMQETLRTNENVLPSEQNKEASIYRPANYVAPETPNRSTQEAQDRASRILGIGKYRTEKIIDPTVGDDDSPYGPQR